jgi:uncharacterized membrane protein
MSELIVFSFENETDAHELESELVAARDAQQIEVGDAAMVVRAADGRAALNHAAKLVGRGSLGGIFWGFMFALVFWGRWWGLSVGGALGDLGMDDDFVKEVGDSIGRGHSGLLILVRDEMVDAVLNVAEGYQPKVTRNTFSEKDEALLKTIFLTTRE